MLTQAEAAAVYEALKSILGRDRAQLLIVEMLGELGNVGPEADLPMIGTRHAAPARPRSVEPEATGSPPRLHSGAEGG